MFSNNSCVHVCPFVGGKSAILPVKPKHELVLYQFLHHQLLLHLQLLHQGHHQ